MKTALPFIPLVLFILLALNGCATQDDFKIAKPIISAKPPSMDNILVVVSGSSSLEAENLMLSVATVSGLKETSQFRKVAADKQELGLGNGIKVSLEILGIKKVTDKARFWIGSLAGKARVWVRITVSDLQTGSQIEVFEVVGESGQTALSGTTDEAIYRAVNQIVAEILKINAGSA